MTLSEEGANMTACLQSNAMALQLLHEGLAYERCLFPLELTNGFQTRLPHLLSCEKAAHLLILQSLDCQRHGDTVGTVKAVVTALHMAEILSNEPTLVGMATRDRILAAVCVCLRECLNEGPLSTQDLALIGTRLEGALSTGERTPCAGVTYERCLGLAVFEGSNQEIAEFLQQGKVGLLIWLGVEATRVEGILQRDATFFLDNLGRVEHAAANPSHKEMAKVLAAVSSDVERNQHLAAGDKSKVNIISCMILPGTIRGMQAHLWTQGLVDATRTVLAVEGYRQEMGRLPPDLQTLVPRFLVQIPEHAETGQPLGLSVFPKGYAVHSPNGRHLDDDATQPKSQPPFESDEVVVRIER